MVYNVGLFVFTAPAVSVSVLLNNRHLAISQ